MIIVLVGMLVAGVLDFAAFVVSIASFALRRRGLGFLALGLALAAIVFDAFGWIVVLRGKDTRGEPITWRDDSELYVVVIAQACVLVLAFIAAITARRGRD